MKPKSTLLRFLALAGSSLLAVSSASAQDGTWSVNSSGNWSDTTKWESGIVANGADNTITFSGNHTKTITLDSDRTIGNIHSIQGDANRIHTIAGAFTLTLAVTGDTPYISASQRYTRTNISVNLAGSDGLQIYNSAGGFFNGYIVLSGNNTYTGGTRLRNGVLGVGSNTALSGGTITFEGGGIAAGDGTDRTLANAIALDGNVLVGKTESGNPTLGTGALTFSNSAATALGATRTFTIDPGLFATFAQAFSGDTFGITKAGDGTLTLSGTNTYTGDTTISGGALVYRSLDAKAATGTHAFSAGTTLGLGVGGAGFFTSTDVDNAFTGTMTGNLDNVTVNANTSVGIDTTEGNLTYATSVSGSPTRGLAKFGANTLTLTGDNTYTGATTVNGGSLVVGSATALGAAGKALSVNGSGTLDFNGFDYNVGAFNGNNVSAIVTNSAAGDAIELTVGTGNTVGNFAGVISGNLSLIKTGTQSLTLISNNNFTGGFTLGGGNVVNQAGTDGLGVAGGTVTVTANSTLTAGGSGAITLNKSIALGGGTLLTFVHGNNSWTISGAVTGAGGVKVNDSGGIGTRTLNLINTGNTFTGAIDLSNGNSDLAVGSLGDGVGAGNIFFGVNNAARNGRFQLGTTAAAPLVLNHRQIEIIAGTGVSGLARIGNANTASSSANTLTINTDLLVTGTGGTKTLQLEGANTGNNAFNGNIGNGGLTALSLNKADASKWIIGGANTYTGTTTVSAGILEIGGSGTLGHVSAGVGDYAGNIAITNTNSGRLVYNSSASQSLSGVVSGTGAVFVEDGTLDLTNDNTYTGATTVNGGTLLINGSTSATSAVAVNGGTLGGSGTIGGNVTVAATANLAPGNSAGTLTLGGNLTFTVTSSDVGDLKYELGPIAASDKIVLTAGTLNIGTAALDLNDFDFTDLGGLQNGTYTLIQTNSTITGTLGAATNGTLGLATIDLQISGDGTDLELVVSGLGGGSPEIAVEQNAIDIPNTTGSKDFGTKTIGTNTDLVFTILNTGDADLNLTGAPLVAITGDADFTVHAQPADNPVLEGDSTTFTVRFNPQASGARSATVSIDNDDSDENPFTFTVNGTGQTSYEAWAGGETFGADANGDGISNGMAFLLGASGPNVNALDKLPTVSESSGNLVLTFSMLNAANRGDAALSVEHSRDLGDVDIWTTVLVPNATGGPTNGVTFTVTANGNLNDVVATINSAEAGGTGKLFGRLEANE
jgi:autotransporter-associated beta strand protein